MQKFASGLNTVVSVIAAVATILMMLHVVVHALARFLFRAPIYGTNELVQFWYLPILALVGLVAAQLQKEHIAVTIAIERMRPATAKVFAVFADVVGMVICIGFAWFGLQEALDNTAKGSTAGVTDIITWPVYYAVPVIFGLFAALLVIDILRILRGGEAEEGLVETDGDELHADEKAL